MVGWFLAIYFELMKQVSNWITASSYRICYPSRTINFRFPARQGFCSSTPHLYITWDLHSPSPSGWATESDRHSPGPFEWATERDLHSPGPSVWATERELHNPGPFRWATKSRFPGNTRFRRL